MTEIREVTGRLALSCLCAAGAVLLMTGLAHYALPLQEKLAQAGIKGFSNVRGRPLRHIQCTSLAFQTLFFQSLNVLERRRGGWRVDHSCRRNVLKEKKL